MRAADSPKIKGDKWATRNSCTCGNAYRVG